MWSFPRHRSSPAGAWHGMKGRNPVARRGRLVNNPGYSNYAVGSVFFAAAAFAFAFFFFLGRVTPELPLQILPFLVLRSPLPIFDTSHVDTVLYFCLPTDDVVSESKARRRTAASAVYPG